MHDLFKIQQLREREDLLKIQQLRERERGRQSARWRRRVREDHLQTLRVRFQKEEKALRAFQKLDQTVEMLQMRDYWENTTGVGVGVLQWRLED